MPKDRAKLVIMLDMDGVMCDFHEAVCNLFKVDYVSMREDWPCKGTYDVKKAINQYSNQYKNMTEEDHVERNRFSRCEFLV